MHSFHPPYRPSPPSSPHQQIQYQSLGSPTSYVSSPLQKVSSLVKAVWECLSSLFSQQPIVPPHLDPPSYCRAHSYKIPPNTGTFSSPLTRDPENPDSSVRFDQKTYRNNRPDPIPFVERIHAHQLAQQEKVYTQ